MKRPTPCNRSALTLAVAGALALSAASFAQDPTTQPETPRSPAPTQPSQQSHEQSSTTTTQTTRETRTTSEDESNREALSRGQEVGDPATRSPADPADPQSASSDASSEMVAIELRILDTDRDGAISATEHEAGARRLFEQMDGDKDGALSASELTASTSSSTADSGAVSAPAEAKIASVDRDSDGKLSAQEHAQASRDMFGQLDGDRDGSLSRRELQMAHDMMQSTEQTTPTQETNPTNPTQ